LIGHYPGLDESDYVALRELLSALMLIGVGFFTGLVFGKRKGKLQLLRSRPGDAADAGRSAAPNHDRGGPQVNGNAMTLRLTIADLIGAFAAGIVIGGVLVVCWLPIAWFVWP
jgi:hypothetical protein